MQYAPEINNTIPNTKISGLKSLNFKKYMVPKKVTKTLKFKIKCIIVGLSKLRIPW